MILSKSFCNFTFSQRDFDEQVREALTFIPVKTAWEVLDNALVNASDDNTKEMIIGASIQGVYTSNTAIRAGTQASEKENEKC